MAKHSSFSSFKNRKPTGRGDVFRPFTASGKTGVGRHNLDFRSFEDHPGEQPEAINQTEFGPLASIEEEDRHPATNVSASTSAETLDQLITDAENQNSGPEEFLSDTEIAKALGDIPVIQPEVKKPQEKISGLEFEDGSQTAHSNPSADPLPAMQADPAIDSENEPSTQDLLIQSAEKLSWQLDQIGEEIQTRVAAEISNNLIDLLRPLVEARYRERVIESLCAEVTAIVKREGVGTLHVHCPAHLAKTIKDRLSPQALKSVVIETTGPGDDLRLEFADTAVVSRFAELAAAFERAMRHE